MIYICLETEICGFVDKTYNPETYKEMICPNCYSLLVKRVPEKINHALMGEDDIEATNDNGHSAFLTHNKKSD